MKKHLKIFALVVLLVFLIAPRVSEAAVGAGVTLDSFMYFMDSFFERIGLAFTFGSEAKARKAMSYAEERILEAAEMTAKNDSNAVKKAVDGYKKNIDIAVSKAEATNNEEFLGTISEDAYRRQEAQRYFGFGF